MCISYSRSFKAESHILPSALLNYNVLFILLSLSVIKPVLYFFFSSSFSAWFTSGLALHQLCTNLPPTLWRQTSQKAFRRLAGSRQRWAYSELKSSLNGCFLCLMMPGCISQRLSPDKPLPLHQNVSQSPRHDRVINWLQSKSQLFDREGSFGGVSQNCLETFPENPPRARTETTGHFISPLSLPFNRISLKLSQGIQDMLKRSWGSSLRRGLGRRKPPASARKITLTNYNPLCFHLFTGSDVSFELVVMFENGPRYTNNPAYWVTVFLSASFFSCLDCISCQAPWQNIQLPPETNRVDGENISG